MLWLSGDVVVSVWHCKVPASFKYWAGFWFLQCDCTGATRCSESTAVAQAALGITDAVMLLASAGCSMLRSMCVDVELNWSCAQNSLPFLLCFAHLNNRGFITK